MKETVSVDPQVMRQACGEFVTGVTVVTTGGPVPHGMTANAFSSVSLDPPLVLVCIDRDAVMHQRLGACHAFGVSVLAASQQSLAQYFADRARDLGVGQFQPVDWHRGPVTGVPLMEGALAHFECESLCTYDGGDHSIFIGSVLSLEHSDAEEALAFHRGRFRRLSTERSGIPA